MEKSSNVVEEVIQKYEENEKMLDQKLHEL